MAMTFPTSVGKTRPSIPVTIQDRSPADVPTDFSADVPTERKDGQRSGRWVDSTQPAVRKVSDGRTQLPASARHPAKHHPAKRQSAKRYPAKRRAADLLIVALLTLAIASNLTDVYGSPAAWAVAAVPATIIGCLTALAGTVKSLRAWWQILFTALAIALAQFVVGPVFLLNETTIAHVIPTLRTLTQGCTAMLGSFKYVVSIVPPIGTANGSLLAVWTICLWSALLTGIFAVSQEGRIASIAVVPVMASTAVCALLGTADGYHRPIFGTFVALILVAWLSVRRKSLEPERWASAAVVIALSASLAVGASLATKPNRTVLRDHYVPPSMAYDYASPLSGMRSYIKDHKDSTLLTVANLPAGSAVRLAVMDSFDGNVWNLSASAGDSATASDPSGYRRVGSAIGTTIDTTIDTDTEGEEFEATFTIHEGLRDYWLPMAGTATSVRFEHEENADSFYYNADTLSAIYSTGTDAGLTYTETGIMSPIPTEEQIGKAEASPISQPSAQDVPKSIDEFATAIAGGEATGGAAALALAHTLKESGWFSHGLDGNYPSLPGHGNHRLSQLLNGTAMVGDSEQYASAMALMARSLGLPSRVVLGFLPKNEDGDASRERTATFSETTVVEFTGNDVAAWVEIRLDGYGWVAFHPTPRETKIPDDERNLAPPNPQTLVRQPPVPLADPLHDDNQATGSSSIGGSTANEIPDNPFSQHFMRVVKTIVICASPIWVPFTVCMLLLGINAIALARARRHGDARQRMAAGWRSIALLARHSGIAVDGTRRDQARIISRRLNIDSDMLLTLVKEADYAAFSGDTIRESRVRRYWRNVDETRRAMLDSLPPARRWKARLSLEGMFR